MWQKLWVRARGKHWNSRGQDDAQQVMCLSSFNKLDEIFDLPLKYGLIKLTYGQIIPSKEDLVNKNFVSGTIPKVMVHLIALSLIKLFSEAIQ